MLDVAAAFICRDDRFLICRRPEGKPRGSLWEFPGGKIENGETPADALARECLEELAMNVSVGRLISSVEYSYPEVTVRLFLLRCEFKGSEPSLLEHSDARWITLEELPNFRFCEADAMLIQTIDINDVLQR